MNPAADLSGLRGLHLPGDAAGAVQGEVVAALILGFAAALLLGLARTLWGRRTRSLRRTALAELAASRGLDPDARLLAQAHLLRRLALDGAGEAASGERGEAWATRLDRLLATDFFTRGAGRALAEGLYRPRAADPAQLDAELGRLIAGARLKPR